MISHCGQAWRGADEIIIPEHDFDMKNVAKRIQEGRDRGKNIA